MMLAAAIWLGFIGSLHCVGMCGPIALALPVRNKTFMAYLVSSVCYNLGRVLTYAIMGLLFGAIGRGFVLAGWQNALSVLTGIAILLFTALPFLRIYTPRYKLIRHTVERIKPAIRNLFRKSSPVSLFLIGVLNGLLPCGLVYLAIAGSLATGHAVKGSLFMAFFGLGTIPAMLSLTLLGRFIHTKFRTGIRRMVPVLTFTMGIVLILRGLNLGIPYISPSVTTNETGTQVHSCCHKPNP